MFNSKVKKLISVLFLTILILSSLSVFAFPKVKAQTTEVTVVSYSWYSAPSDTVMAAEPGDLIVVGEVQNVGTSTIQSVVVIGWVYDTNNNELAETTVPVYGGYYLLPGQKAPFYMDFTPYNSYDPAGTDQDWIPDIGNISVTPIDVVNYNQTGYSGLTIPTNSVSASASSGNYTVTGTLTNSGNQIVSDPTVSAAFYNASGTVIGVDFTRPLETALAPHASVSFTVTPTDDTTQMTDAITNYTLLAQYTPYTAKITPTPISQTPTPSNDATLTPTNSQASAQNKISSTTLLEILGVVVVVIVLGLLVAVFMVRRQRRTKQFESSPPPPENNLPPPPPPS